MSDKSMIIIGAGLAGLATGCYARMNGYRTRIFEQHTAPGGVCTAWQRQGYTIDGDIEWLMGCQPGSRYYHLYQELGVIKDCRLLPLNEFCSFLDEKTGRSMAVTSDLDRLAADMKAMAPADRGAIEEFINGCRTMQGFTGVPQPEMVELFKKYNMPIAEFAGRIEDPFLRWSISNMNELPETPVTVLFFILGGMADRQYGLVEGGSLNFSLAVARRYQDLQGEIAYGAHVAEILVENDRAVGIRLADGGEHRADMIVSAADGYSTIFQMLSGRYADQGIRERYDRWPLFPSIHFVSFGVARQFPGESPQKMILLKEPLDTGGRIVEAFRLRVFNGPSLAPEGKTVIQVKVETDFDHWYHLQVDRSRYEAEKARLADAVLQRLEGLYPGISPRIEMTDVATPYTLWRYTRNYRGAYEGWKITMETARAVIPKTLPGLADFYMGGQWVQPGGGIPPVLNSGRSLVQMLCEQDGKNFSAVVPA